MIKKNNFEIFGKLLIDIQFLETLIKFYTSYFTKELKEEYKIRELSPKSILDDSDNSRKTLGQLMKIIKSEVKDFDNKEFQELLQKRNVFIHNFHKEYLSIGAQKENELSSFVIRLSELVKKYTNIFTGLHSLSIRTISKGKISIQGIEDNEIDLIRYIEERRNL